MAIRTYSYKNDKNKSLSKNFKVSEFWSSKSGNDKILIDDKLVSLLQTIRDNFKSAVIITSAYRPEPYNTKIGGASNSYHTKGMACDFYISGKNVEDIARYAESLNIKGIGCYKDDLFVHIDTRTSKFFWYNQSNTPTDTFGKIAQSYPLVSFGSRNSYVTILQNRLNEKEKANLSVDGIFGAATQNAVKEFQKKYKLDVDSIVGEKTWKKLLEG